MEPLGAKLKAAREQKQLTLTKVAGDIRIGSVHLSNLETGNYAALPGGVYNRAFLRAYCEYLGLDAQEMLDCYRNETSPPADRQSKARPRATPLATRFTAPPVVTWSILLVASIAGLYYSRRWIADVFSPYFVRAPVTAPLPANAGPPDISQARPAAQVPVAPPVVAVQQAGEQPPGTETDTGSTLPPQAPGTIRLKLQVTQRCWVSITSDGSRVLVKLLEPGDIQAFDAVESFYVILGNAGGVQATINGKQAKPFGKDGEVVKVLINQQTLSGLLEQPRG